MWQVYYSRVGVDEVGLVGIALKRKSTEPLDAVNISPLARFKPQTRQQRLELHQQVFKFNVSVACKM